MSDIFGTGLSFWDILIGFLTIVFGIVAIRISFQFDLNKFLDSRRTALERKLINSCPHVQLITTEDRKIQGTSLYISPPGTIQWQCQKCGHCKYVQGDEIDREIKYYMENINIYHKKQEQFNKILKKLGAL